jgi:hypothetical protein
LAADLFLLIPDDSIDSLNEDVQLLFGRLLRLPLCFTQLARFGGERLNLHRRLFLRLDKRPLRVNERLLRVDKRLLKVDERAACEDQVSDRPLVLGLDFRQGVDGVLDFCESFFGCHRFHVCTRVTFLSALLYNNLALIIPANQR